MGTQSAAREGCPVTDFDHHSDLHNEDPAGSFAREREAHPVAWTEAHGGYWLVTDWGGVAQVSADDETFSSARGPSGGEGLAIVIPKVPTALHIPIELDPPEFQPYRRLLMQFAKASAIEELTPMIEAHTTAFIDEVIELGECDLASVVELPAIVTVDWLGLDPADYQVYSKTMFAMVAEPPGSGPYMDAVERGIPAIERMVREHIARCREERREGVIAGLVEAEVDGRALDDDEVYSMAELLITGGVGTTASLIGQALVWIAANPVEKARLAADAELRDGTALEEFLRVFSPTQALARTVTREVEVEGCPMHAGDRVLISWAAANRDPARYEDPDRLDLDRNPNRHAAFGLGIHRCAGLHLARAMSRAVIGQVLERMPDYEVDRAGLERYPTQGLNVGWKRIPVRFTPGARREDG
jgi:cytochrome P450